MAFDDGKMKFVIELDNEKLRRDISESQQQFQSLSQEVKSEGATIDSSFKKIGGVIAGAFAVTSMVNFAQEIVRVRGEIQTLEMSFNALLKSQERTDEVMGFITDFGAKTAYSTTQIGEAVKTMVGFNVEYNKVIPLAKSMGEIAMGNAQSFNSLALAFSQASSLGKLMGGDFMQMVNAGFNPLNEMAKMTGKSIGELKDDMAQGKISIDMLEQAFLQATSSGGSFHGMIEGTSSGIEVAQAKLRSSIVKTFNDIGASQEELIVKGYDFANKMVQNFDTIAEAILVLVSTMGIYKAALFTEATLKKATAGLNRTTSILAEGKAIDALATAEERNILTKQGLKRGTIEYYTALKAQTAETAKALSATLTTAQAELATKRAVHKEALKGAIVAKEEVRTKAAALAIAKKEGDAGRIAIAQKELDNAVTQRSIAVKRRKVTATELEIATSKKSNAQTALNTVQTALNTGATQANVASRTLARKVTDMLTASWKRLTAAMSANKFALIATLIAGVIYGLYKLITAESAAQKALRKHNEELERNKQLQEERRNQIDSDIATLQNETSTTLQKTIAYDRLRASAKSLTDQYSQQELQTLKLEDAQKLLNEQFDAEELVRLQGEVKKFEDRIAALNKRMEMPNQGGYLYEIREIEKANEQLKLAQKSLDDYYDAKRRAEYEAKPIEVKIEMASDNVQRAQAEVDRLRAIVDKQKAEVEGKPWKIPLGFSTEAVQLEDAEKYLNEQKAAYSSLLQTQTQLETVGERRARWAKELKTYEQEYRRLSADDSTATQEELENLQRQIEERKKLLGVEKDGKSGQQVDLKAEAQERERMIREQALEEARLVVDMRFAIRQAEINAEEEGAKKTLEQLRLNHDKELEELKRQREDSLRRKQDNAERLFKADSRNRNRPFDRSAVQLSEGEARQYEQLEGFLAAKHKLEHRKALEEQEQHLKELLQQYATFAQKSEDIEAKRVEAIRELRERGQAEGDPNRYAANISIADEEARRKQEDLAVEYAMKEEEFQAWARSVSNLAIYELEEQIDAAKQKLEALIKGNAGQEEIAKATAGIKVLEDAKRALGDLSPSERAQRDWQKINESVGRVAGQFSQLGSAFGGAVGEIMSSTGDVAASTTQVISGIMKLTDGSIQAIKGASAGATAALQAVETASVILAVVGALISITQKIVSLATRLHDGKYEEQIDLLQGKIESLQQSYKLLGREIETAFGKDASNLIAQQNQLLRQQQVAMRAQIKAEQSKKKSDSGKIGEWEKAIRDIDDAIEENARKAEEAIFGKDVRSAIEDFANAWADAFDVTGDKAKSAKQIVKEQIKAMVMESIKAMSSQPMQALRKKMQEFWQDGIISQAEEETLNRMASDLQKRIDSEFGWAERFFSNGTDDQASREASRGSALQSITQDQASSIEGRIVGIQLNSEIQKELAKANAATLSDIRAVTQQAVGLLSNISHNSSYLPMIESLATSLASMRTDLSEIKLKGTKIRS